MNYAAVSTVIGSLPQIDVLPKGGMNMKKTLMVVILCVFMPGAMCKDNPIITMDELRDNLSKYESKLIDVTGEVIVEYHGPALRDEDKSFYLFIMSPEYVSPKPRFKLREDRLYDEFEDLSREVGLVQRSLGKAKLMATLRGQIYYFAKESGNEMVEHPPDISWIQTRFVLQRVMKLDVQALTPENAPSDE